jgi:hypothetical protein
MTEEAVALILRLRRDRWRPLDVTHVHQRLTSTARTIMLPHLPMLIARTVSATTEVEIRSEGWTERGRLRSLASVLVVRAGDDILTSRSRLR